MKVGKIKSLLFALSGCFYAVVAYSAASLFSDYGQIQNVQNYSTNPFWTPNSPYNQKMPQPVYVQGTAISNEECVNVLQSAVSMQCMARDNCKNTTLSDIRPAIIVQLSNLPNKAYSTACIGYLDTVYESYVAQYGNNAPTGRVDFPTATTPNPALNNNNAPVIQNPYKIQTPKWKQEINERANELEQLQKQTNSVNMGLAPTAFPTTYADLSFTERMENDKEGYAPYKGTTAYRTINVNFNTADWCSSHAGAPECKEYEAAKKREEAKRTAEAKGDAKILPSELQKLVNAIVKALNPKDDQQKTFLTALVTQYVEKEANDSSVVLDDKFVYDFLSDGDRLDRYKVALTSLTGSAFDETLKINLDWDEILRYVSTILDSSRRLRGALVCENNRSLQVGLDAAMWTATIWSLGSTAAVQAALHAGASAGLKALAKGALKVGAEGAANFLSTQGRKQFATAATKLALQGLGERFTIEATLQMAKKIGANIATKRGALLAAGAGVIYQTKGKQSLANSMEPTGGFSKRAAGFLYSLVNSEPSTTMVNCQDLDKGERCYHICGSARAPDDDLNNKVFQPIMGKKYCVDKDDYTLYEIDTKKPLMMDDNQYKQIVAKIHSSITNQGHCDWNEDDIEMYIGSYMYDPDTLEPSSELVIEDVIRLDD